MDAFEDIQVPPGSVIVKLALLPTHTFETPLITAETGSVFTVKGLIA